MGVHYRVLLVAGVGGWVIGMPAKIIRALGDVGVLSIWLDRIMISAGGGGGKRTQ